MFHFVCTWNVSIASISYRKALLNESVGQEHDATGIALDSDCPSIATSRGALYSYVLQHYKERDHSEQKSNKKSETRSDWIETIGVQHCHATLSELVESGES